MPVTASFSNAAPGLLAIPQAKVLFSVNLASTTALYVGLEAAGLALLASVGFDRYSTQIRRRAGSLRWLAMGIPAVIMYLLIAMIAGVTDLAALLMLTSSMVACFALGSAAEANVRTTGSLSWTLFGFGCFAGGMPWLVIVLYAAMAGGAYPSFLVALVALQMVATLAFPLNLAITNSRFGWSALTGEVIFVLISLMAKTLLAWMVFGFASLE